MIKTLGAEVPPRLTRKYFWRASEGLALNGNCFPVFALKLLASRAGVSLQQLEDSALSKSADVWCVDFLHPAIVAISQWRPVTRKPQLLRQPAPQPSLATKARSFATSAAKHLAAGMPQATEKQLAARFAICQGCEHFDGTACRQCGCPVVREKKFLSKLSWAGESCPVGKWGPVSS